MEKGSKYPPIWGHILGGSISALNQLHVGTGSLVIFHRFATDLLRMVRAQEPLYDGEKLPIEIIHIDSIQAVMEDDIIRMRV